MPVKAKAQSVDQSVAQVQKLSEQDNHREAANPGKAALAKPDAKGELLEVTVTALGQPEPLRSTKRLLRLQ